MRIASAEFNPRSNFVLLNDPEIRPSSGSSRRLYIKAQRSVGNSVVWLDKNIKSDVLWSNIKSGAVARFYKMVPLARPRQYRGLASAAAAERVCRTIDFFVIASVVNQHLISNPVFQRQRRAVGAEQLAFQAKRPALRPALNNGTGAKDQAARLLALPINSHCSFLIDNRLNPSARNAATTASVCSFGMPSFFKITADGSTT